MILSKEQRDEFDKLVVPVMEFLDRSYHPHVKLIIDSAHAELVEGVVGTPNKKYSPVELGGSECLSVLGAVGL